MRKIFYKDLEAGFETLNQEPKVGLSPLAYCEAVSRGNKDVVIVILELFGTFINREYQYSNTSAVELGLVRGNIEHTYFGDTVFRKVIDIATSQLKQFDIVRVLIIKQFSIPSSLMYALMSNLCFLMMELENPSSISSFRNSFHTALSSSA